METKFKTTSFVPKASLTNVVDEKGKINKKESMSSYSSSFIILTSFFIFICSVVSAGIVFSLNRYSIATKESLAKSLENYRKDINKETIEEIKSLNDRLAAIDYLLDEHVAVSQVFDQLAQNTIKKVSFNSFNLKKTAENTFALSLKAEGIGYESVVSQDIQFSSPLAQKFFKNTSITDFSKSKGQSIANFGIETNISNSAVNFSELIK